MVTFLGAAATGLGAALDPAFEAGLDEALVGFSDLVVLVLWRELFTTQPMMQKMMQTTRMMAEMMRKVKSGFFWQKVSGVFHWPLPFFVTHLRFMVPS